MHAGWLFFSLSLQSPGLACCLAPSLNANQASAPTTARSTSSRYQVHTCLFWSTRTFRLLPTSFCCFPCGHSPSSFNFLHSRVPSLGVLLVSLPVAPGACEYFLLPFPRYPNRPRFFLLCCTFFCGPRKPRKRRLFRPIALLCISFILGGCSTIEAAEPRD